MVSLAIDINTDPGHDRTMDSDMVLGTDVTMPQMTAQDTQIGMASATLCPSDSSVALGGHTEI